MVTPRASKVIMEEEEMAEAETQGSPPVKVGLNRIRSRFVKPKPNLSGSARRLVTPATPPQPSSKAVDCKAERPTIASPPPVTRLSTVSERQDPIGKWESSLDSDVIAVDDDNEVEEPPPPPSEEGSEVDCEPPLCMTLPQVIVVDASPSTAGRSKESEKLTGQTEKRRISSRRRPRKKPEKEKMTMQDLIYWNPQGSPMKYDSEERIPLSNMEMNSTVSTDPESATVAEESIDDPENEPDAGGDCVDDGNDTLTPRLKIGPDGKIVFDEKSLVIETTASKNNVSNDPVVHENLLTTKTYSCFRKHKPTAKWTDKQTEKFYLALSAVGTDFSMMEDLFPKRTRHELKLKFNREDRLNRALVEKAIGERHQFDFSLFNDNDEDDELTDSIRKSKEQCKSRRKQTDSALEPTPKRKRTYKRRGRKQQQVEDIEMEDEEEEEEDDSATVEDVTVSDDDIGEMVPTGDLTTQSDEEEEVVDGFLKMTRSGRQPKKKAVYESERRPRSKKKSPPNRPADESSLSVRDDDDDGAMMETPGRVPPSQKPVESGSLVCSPRGSEEQTPPFCSPDTDSETRVYAEMVPVAVS